MVVVSAVAKETIWKVTGSMRGWSEEKSLAGLLTGKSLQSCEDVEAGSEGFLVVSARLQVDQRKTQGLLAAPLARWDGTLACPVAVEQIALVTWLGHNRYSWTDCFKPWIVLLFKVGFRYR